ncbi:MAG TPA: N-acetylmuramoyl-L-alanine amidase [Candidatus Baltobacteraceae bacterium]|nr:N-acetylmuramoyl-L-alanine amidase [Candidatus Baltobacteraceae bacterium]
MPPSVPSRTEHLARSAIVRRFISAILFGVRNVFGAVALAFCLQLLVMLVPFVAAQVPDQQGNQQQAPQSATPPAEQTPPPSQPPVPAGPVIVLNPAHGGTDSGARGQNGATEKDIVLRMARGVKAELERRGFRVIMTRNDDSNPSYDDRAAMANTYHDAIFISLHVASTGTVGSFRAYYDQMSAPYVAPAEAANAPAKAAFAGGSGLNSWNDAQRPYLTGSHRLADLIQIELAQKFSGTADSSLGAAVRGLRSVAGPAVAIELSSVSAKDPDALANSDATPLADAIAEAVTAFRAVTPGGARP